MDSTFIAPSMDSLQEPWRTRFMLIEKAGGTKLKGMAALSSKERQAVMWNLWAFVFQVLYFIRNGMWKKGLTYTAIGIACVLLIQMLISGWINIPSFVINIAVHGAIFATRANVDYYKKIMQNDNGWI